MTILEAQEKINQMRTEDFNSSALNILERWNQVLVEIQNLDLNSNEQDLIKQELNIHLYKMESNPTRKNLKGSLNSFLKFLDNTLQIKSGNKILGFGLIFGILLAFLSGISIWMGLLIGVAAGFSGVFYVRSKYRYLKTNLEDIW